MFGTEFKNQVLKLNASDNRGIDVIRGKIKDFCRKEINSAKFKIKVLILDEADSLTESAQEAMRRTMEKFSDTSRFILICNFSSKIIEPIQSRCSILVFKYPNFEELLNFVIKNLEKRNKSYNLFRLESIIYSSDGDFRSILKEIESYGNTKKKGIFSKNFIFILETKSFPEFLISCKNQNFYLGMTIIQQIWSQGISDLDIINGLFKTIKNISIQENIKLKILNLLCEIRLKLVFKCQFEKILFYMLNKLKLLL